MLYLAFSVLMFGIGLGFIWTTDVLDTDEKILLSFVAAMASLLWPIILAVGIPFGITFGLIKSSRRNEK